METIYLCEDCGRYLVHNDSRLRETYHGMVI